MSVCSQCGSVLPTNTKVCNSCGSPVRTLQALSPHLGVHKSFVRTVPFWKIVSGVVVIVAGIVVASLSFSFAPVAVIIMVIGLIVVALGIMSAKAPVEREVYQT